MSKTFKKSIEAINQNGILLVYPINNKKEPPSIWSSLYPRSEMKWEWDTEGDDRVAELWHLRMELSTSRKVVYAKWYQGRATFFSREVFRDLLAFYGTAKRAQNLGRESSQILEIVEMDSPLSTKELKKAAGLQGKLLESTFQKAMKELWNPLLIVGFGEVEDGAFPSLAVGATRLLFEDLWEESQEVDPKEAYERLQRVPPKFLKFIR